MLRVCILHVSDDERLGGKEIRKEEKESSIHLSSYSSRLFVNQWRKNGRQREREESAIRYTIRHILYTNTIEESLCIKTILFSKKWRKTLTKSRCYKRQHVNCSKMKKTATSPASQPQRNAEKTCNETNIVGKIRWIMIKMTMYVMKNSSPMWYINSWGAGVLSSMYKPWATKNDINQFGECTMHVSDFRIGSVMFVYLDRFICVFHRSDHTMQYHAICIQMCSYWLDHTIYQIQGDSINYTMIFNRLLIKQKNSVEIRTNLKKALNQDRCDCFVMNLSLSLSTP